MRLLVLFIPTLLCAAPYGSGLSFGETVDNLHHELENHQEEMQMFEERLKNQELIMDSLRDEVLSTSEELTKDKKALELTIKNAIQDIQKLQTHANDSTKALKQTQQKITAIDQKLTLLQETVEELMEILNPTANYKVQSRDSLEKIARKHKTTVKKLKEANNLKNDKIIVGQSLKIP